MNIDDLAVALVRASPIGYFKLAQVLRKIRPSLRSVPVNTRYGKMICDVGEPDCFPLVKFGRYRHWVDDEALIERLPLNRTSVVVDVGANIGALARLFARRVGTVHAFEPSPRALSYLRRNADANVVVHAIALSDREGIATFEEHESLDLSSFSEHGIEVETRTLDSFKLKPDLIKIDVEGFEPAVLRGARETLKQSPFLLFEALDEEALGDCRREILSANPEYVIERVSEFNYLATTRPL